MSKILAFLKPSLAKVALFVTWWVIFYLVYLLIFKACIFADCKNAAGGMIPCCRQAKTALAYFIYHSRVWLLIVDYLFSCFLANNLENPGAISHQARQL